MFDAVSDSFRISNTKISIVRLDGGPSKVKCRLLAYFLFYSKNWESVEKTVLNYTNVVRTQTIRPVSKLLSDRDRCYRHCPLLTLRCVHSKYSKLKRSCTGI